MEQRYAAANSALPGDSPPGRPLREAILFAAIALGLSAVYGALVVWRGVAGVAQ